VNEYIPAQYIDAAALYLFWILLANTGAYTAGLDTETGSEDSKIIPSGSVRMQITVYSA